MRNIGPEAARSYQRRVDSGFFKKYLSGKNLLDIWYRGEDQTSVPIVEQAIGIDLDYPGYDGVHLPFPDGSQDTVFSSHSYEHIADYRVALREWNRVLKVGGFISCSCRTNTSTSARARRRLCSTPITSASTRRPRCCASSRNRCRPTASASATSPRTISASTTR